MKKVGSFILHSITRFGVYLLVTLLTTAILQSIMRLFIPANSVGEYLWKSVLSYVIMLAVSAVYLRISGSEHKRAYLVATEGVAWNIGYSMWFTIKNVDFWSRVLAFSIWPVIIPKFFGAIDRLYVREDFLTSFPSRVLVLATVNVPFLVMQLGAWILVTYLWHKNRMHR